MAAKVYENQVVVRTKEKLSKVFEATQQSLVVTTRPVFRYKPAHNEKYIPSTIVGGLYAR